MEEFDAVIGLDRLKAIHMNDSKNPPGSHKDRHEKLGEGTIGKEALVRILNHPRLRGIPVYLETPQRTAGLRRRNRLPEAGFSGRGGSLTAEINDFLKFHRTAEEVQGAADGYIQPALAFLFQLLQIPEAADASGVGDRKPFHLSQQPYQFRLNAGSFPLHIHRVG